MSTHALTKVVETGDVLVAMYTHWDGYPSGYGKELYDFLKDIKLVNGLGATNDKVANGAGCLAAQMIAHFKTEPGNIYLVPVNNPDEEYNYTIYIDSDNEMTITVINILKENLFEGDLTAFGEWIKDNKG